VNPYLDQIHQVLPQLLGFYDSDPFSRTYGVGDRYYWAWKLIDFPNGTFQGIVNGLARLLRADLLLPEFVSCCEGKIDSIFRGADSIRRANGSVEEAFPHESSFCVTALVAYDLLTAIEILDGQIGIRKKEQYLQIVKPMISFLRDADESHALISNHLATAAAALFKWSSLTSERVENNGRKFLDRILQHQCSEGWYREYEGPDPGYQTLCTYYLADLHRMRPDLGLQESLERSIQFLWHFAHPDGSFGGLYGSRNTRFYYPAGVRFLAQEIGEAAALDQFMGESVAEKTVVSLVAMDPQNVVPMFNAYAWAAVQGEVSRKARKGHLPVLPCLRCDEWSKDFPQGGLHVRSGKLFYTIVSFAKGGVVAHYDRSRKKMTWNAGTVVEERHHSRLSTQAWCDSPKVIVEGDQMVIESPLTKMNQELTTPFRFLALRIMSLTFMRIGVVNRIIKKLLVWMLITRKRRGKARVKREIRWEKNGQLVVSDTLLGEGRATLTLHSAENFRSIHMASAGYWQRGEA